MSKLGQAVGDVAGAIGLRGLYYKPKSRKSEIVMPDEEALQRAARKRGALRARRSGRVSTILDSKETLG